MKLTEQTRARMYALTALACVVWLVQSLVEAAHSSSLLSWPNVVFSICLLVVIGYTGYCAVTGWNAEETKRNEDQGDSSEQADISTDQTYKRTQ